MKKRLNIGNSDFKSFIEDNSYYIDKSLFIEEMFFSPHQVMLIPRPRRFGKTLNLSMLKYYFDILHPENKILFKDLKIWQADDEIKEQCCKYPVIYVSFKDAKSDNWEEVLSNLKHEIIKLFSTHYYLLEKNVLYPYEVKKFNAILDETADISDYSSSLKFLSEYLYRYHKQKVIILTDEYDAPIQAGYKKFYDEVVKFMRNLLSGAYKDNVYLKKGVITGILRVSKESIFSGLNNPGVYTILTSRFSDKFGFTEQEVLQIFKDLNIQTDFNEVKKWYNGYKIGRTEGIYNPWSILNYASAPGEGFRTFWSNTSSNDLIKREIQNKNADEIRADVLKLINGETVAKNLEENFVFSDLQTNKELLWTLLTFSGYLTITEKVGIEKYKLRVPNYELKIIFKKTILEWLEYDVKIRSRVLEETINCLINNDLREFERGFKEIIGDTFSYYDTVRKNEYVYQSYILGLLAIIGDDYIIKSNRESGEGRYDIMLIPHDKRKNGIIIEIKQISKQKSGESDEDFAKRVNKYLDIAGEQIDKNKYYNELIANKIPENKIIKVPIVFAGKEPYIFHIEPRKEEL